jgi:predicted naringenin-chalcone synthase
MTNVSPQPAHCLLHFGDLIAWEVTDAGFRMGLSKRVPDVLGRAVKPLVADLCERNGTTPAEVSAWAVHPGGPRVLDVVADRLSLSDDLMEPSRAVLARHGNCSSATVLLVLDEIRRHRCLKPGQTLVALAFGPGLSLYAALLRTT